MIVHYCRKKVYIVSRNIYNRAYYLLSTINFYEYLGQISEKTLRLYGLQPTSPTTRT